MLAKRSLSLASFDVLAEPVLRREDIADMQRACEVLDTARREAQQLLADAAEQAQREREQALAQFWTQANAVLEGLELQRQRLQQDALETLEALLNESLARLLDEASLAERTRAVVRNLADSQRHAVLATLSAHPDRLDDLAAWLAQSRFAEHWQLKGDPLMPDDALRLSDEQGAFDIDWASLRRGLLGADAATA
ncbi:MULTISPECIES: type III secretion system stator protein SctL [unclassified Pseudomonas]|uniref:type III secretion system stator protein SctL n=1 Tax=unclassified Pseudomonas TaxID=196821 RepID=UPI000D334988|nr:MULTISPECIES: type III secretion system stator protein SctL [unclassified Pseudomonas]RAU41493.1 HrpE/YscL family type III secretion apparatus protein [Pseudomonas sp. RIT 409]RAU53316.1 HrpE/YscL family type III secretion apparatus protein [Pseudomonas sp. RIT 412]